MKPNTPPLYLLHGMKRSGNHALVNWLQPQLGFRFLNNVIPIAPILLNQKKMPAPVDYDVWRHSANIGKTPVLASLEDHDLKVNPFKNIDSRFVRLLIVRHPDNLFSSRIHKAFLINNPAYPRNNGDLMQRVVNLWKQHARAYLEPGGEHAGRIAILFDAWFRDEDYRRAISEKLNIPFDDSGYAQVSRHGGGSSFDGTRWHGDNRKMSVNSRADELNDTERALLDELYEDKELLALREAFETTDPRHLL